MTGHSFSAIQKEPAYLKVAKAIEADISARRLLPGDTLPTETELSVQFGLNRSTVREGIRLLEQQGLLERGEGKRLIIRQPAMGDIAQRASHGLAFGGVTFREVWEALATFQPAAARLVAQRGDPTVIAKLKEITGQLGAAKAKDNETTVRAAKAFFTVLAENLDNRVLEVMLHSMTHLIAASLMRVIDGAPRARQRILEAQRQLIEAFETSDEDAAALWMRRHIGDLKRAYEVAQVDLDESVL